ncbi:type II toxin-antitoxin system VapC family toxin [Leucobacter sp. HNU]|uniref:type II toxin-antitoxin system VapC family toxin n=1 Tax=Leucobacter sp. HNU TaxID=3236805 RepID=UPI003A80B51F
MLVYADTSALAKLIVEEPESDALVDWYTEVEAVLVTSDLARVELMRTVHRIDPELSVDAHDLLRSCEIISLDSIDYERAGTLPPAPLRSLDALHLIAAQNLGDALDAILTYDIRLAEAAAVRGIRPVHPGRERLISPAH